MEARGPEPERPRSLLAELQERRVFRVAGAYVLAAWILMQAGEIVVPAFELPNRALRMLILALVAGLPVVVVLAWFVDFGPRGIRISRSTQVEDEAEAPIGANSALEMLLLGVAIPVVGFGLLLGVLAWQSDGDISGIVPAALLEEGPSLAVLPFEEISAAGDDGRFFSAGMHEDVLTQLARIPALKLISRSSVMPYADTGASAVEIGQQLGVAHVLEGRVRRSDSRVRVTAHLIDTRTDEEIWAEQFDGSLADVFEVQDRIAHSIARALRTELTADVQTENARLEVAPAAYDAYLKAREIHRNLDTEDARALDRARHLYETAVRLDDRFTAAWLELGTLHSEAYWFGFDASESRTRAAQRALDRARELGAASDRLALAEGIFAYYVQSDFGKANLHFELAARLAPGNADAHFYRAMILRRGGELKASLASQARALELDPLNLGRKDEYALTLALAGSLADARALVVETLRVEPDRPRARLFKWQLDLELGGDPARLLDEMAAAASPRWQAPHYSLLEHVAVLAGAPQRAAELISARARDDGTGYRAFRLALLAAYEGDVEAEAELLISARESFERFLSRSGDRLPPVERRRIEALLAFQSGDVDRAIELQRENVDANPIERDTLAGISPLWLLTHFQLASGRAEEAAQSLERLTRFVDFGSVLYGGFYTLANWPDYADTSRHPAVARVARAEWPGYAARWPSTAHRL